MTNLEAWLVLRAQSGDREALNELLGAVHAPLHRYLLRLTGDREAAEEAVQETLLRAYKKLRWLDDPVLFRPWIYRIASREAFRFLARRRRWSDRTVPEETVDDPVDESPTPEDALSSADIDRLIDQTSPASRAVLLLHYQQGMSLEETGGVLGLAVGTVKSRLAYGLRTLRKTFSRKDL